MRNAVQRRNHRERGQLEGREKWGLLEKKKVRYQFWLPRSCSGQDDSYRIGLLAASERLQSEA